MEKRGGTPLNQSKANSSSRSFTGFILEFVYRWKSVVEHRSNGAVFFERGYHQATAFQEKMYLIGGTDKNAKTDDVWVSIVGKSVAGQR